MRKKAIEWYELSDEQKKFASISQESAKIILEKFNSIYPQWTIRNIDKCAEKLIMSEEKALFVMYTIVDKAKRSKASDKANRLNRGNISNRRNLPSDLKQFCLKYLA